jgi:hypothetical protein
MSTPAAPQDDVPGWQVQAATQSLGQLAGDTQLLLNRVAEQFTAAWPEVVRVRRKGLFNRGDVVAVSIRFSDRQFELDRSSGEMRAVIAEAHGGVAISHQELEVHAWIDALLATLASRAERSALAREALLGLMS